MRKNICYLFTIFLLLGTACSDVDMEDAQIPTEKEKKLLPTEILLNYSDPNGYYEKFSLKYELSYDDKNRLVEVSSFEIDETYGNYSIQLKYSYDSQDRLIKVTRLGNFTDDADDRRLKYQERLIDYESQPGKILEDINEKTALGMMVIRSSDYVLNEHGAIIKRTAYTYRKKFTEFEYAIEYDRNGNEIKNKRELLYIDPDFFHNIGVEYNFEEEKKSRYEKIEKIYDLSKKSAFANLNIPNWQCVELFELMGDWAEKTENNLTSLTLEKIRMVGGDIKTTTHPIISSYNNTDFPDTDTYPSEILWGKDPRITTINIKYKEMK